MFPQSQGLLKEDHNMLAGTKVDEGKRVQTLDAADLSSLRRQEHLESLLPIDLTQHRGDSDKLLSIAIDLQTLGREQKAEIKKLQAKHTIVETKTVSSGYSRHGTNDSKSSTATSLGGDPEETVLVFSLLDNGLTVRQVKGMKGMFPSAYSLKQTSLLSSGGLIDFMFTSRKDHLLNHQNMTDLKLSCKAN
jgi:hypothetical protein